MYAMVAVTVFVALPVTLFVWQSVGDLGRPWSLGMKQQKVRKGTSV